MGLKRFIHWRGDVFIFIRSTGHWIRFRRLCYCPDKNETTMLILWLFISSNFNPIVSEHLGLNLRWLRIIKPTGWDYHLMEPVARTAGDHGGQKDSSSMMVTCNKFSGGHPTLFLLPSLIQKSKNAHAFWLHNYNYYRRWKERQVRT